MRIGILSRSKRNYSTRHLARAARARGHRVTIMDPFDCALFLGARRPTVTHRGRSVEGLDVLIPRLSSATAAYGLEVIAHFEQAGVPSVNPSTAITTARNKWRALRVLAQNGVPVPPSFAAGNVEDVDRAVKRTGGYPIVAKPFQGTGGEGIMLFDTPLTVKSALDTVWSLRQDYIGQRFYMDVQSDVRLFVVGDAVVGAMERTAREGDFRANVHRGAMGRAIAVEDGLVELGLRVARAIGLGVAGIDVLVMAGTTVVLEANPSPGFEGLEQVTGQDVAAQVIRYAERVGGDPSG